MWTVALDVNIVKELTTPHRLKSSLDDKRKHDTLPTALETVPLKKQTEIKLAQNSL